MVAQNFRGSTCDRHSDGTVRNCDTALCRHIICSVSRTKMYWAVWLRHYVGTSIGSGAALHRHAACLPLEILKVRVPI